MYEFKWEFGWLTFLEFEMCIQNECLWIVVERELLVEYVPNIIAFKFLFKYNFLSFCFGLRPNQTYIWFKF